MGHQEDERFTLKSKHILAGVSFLKFLRYFSSSIK